MERVLLVLRIELGDDLARFEHIAHIHRPLDHASFETKSEADLVLGVNLAGQRHNLASSAAPDRDRADGPRSGVRRYGLLATCDGSGDQAGRNDPRLEHWSISRREDGT